MASAGVRVATFGRELAVRSALGHGAARTHAHRGLSTTQNGGGEEGGDGDGEEERARRPLVPGPNPLTTIEPSEAATHWLDRPGGMIKPRDVYAAATPSKSRGLQAGAIVGGITALGGISVLGYANFDLWFNLNTLGTGMLMVGALVTGGCGAQLKKKNERQGAQLKRLSESVRIAATGGPEDGDLRFRFTSLGDADAVVNETMQTFVNRDGTDLKWLPAPMQARLRAKEEKEERSREEFRAARRDFVVAEVERELDAKTSARRVRQMLDKKLFVITYDTFNTSPNMRGTAKVDGFTATVSMLLATCSPYDEVVVRITSPGGAVSTYGHIAAEMLRLRKAGIKVTACVDYVAASGGYMMACVADRVVASPFAFLGSIGVVSGMPNFNRLLKKNQIDYLQFTAGKYKRTVTPFGEVEEEGKRKFQEDLDDIHRMFQEHVSENRHQLDIDDVATGEAWLAIQALERGLVDQIATSDEYIRSRMVDFDVIRVDVHKKLNLQRLFGRAMNTAQTTVASLARLVPGAGGGGGSNAGGVHGMPAVEARASISADIVQR